MIFYRGAGAVEEGRKEDRTPCGPFSAGDWCKGYPVCDLREIAVSFCLLNMVLSSFFFPYGCRKKNHFLNMLSNLLQPETRYVSYMFRYEFCSSFRAFPSRIIHVPWRNFFFLKQRRDASGCIFSNFVAALRRGDTPALCQKGSFLFPCI